MRTVYLEFKVSIPDWAEWVAQDADGGVFLYENEPTAYFNLNQFVAGRKCQILARLDPNPNWKNTKQRIDQFIKINEIET